MTSCRTAYGLVIASELPLPELPVSDAEPDVVVRFGEVPHAMPEPLLRQSTIQAVPGLILLHFAELGGIAVMIRDGCEIVIAPGSTADQQTLRMVVLSVGLAGILCQRGVLPLHGNAIETPHGAVVIAGESGAGKSTLSLTLMQRGYRVLTDDLCVIESTDGLRVLPGIPRLKLWPDIARTVPAGDSGLLEAVRPGVDKFGLALDGQFCDRALPLWRIYILQTRFQGQPALTELTGANKIEALREQQFNFAYAEPLVEPARLFAWLVRLSGAARVMQVIRPGGRTDPDVMADLLVRDFTP